jgi:hypothetical protein
VKLCALLRAGIYEGVVAPLPLLAQQWFAISCRTAGTCRSGLLAHGATRDRVLVPLRLGQSNGHANCKQRYSESFGHGFFSLVMRDILKRDLPSHQKLAWMNVR